MILPKRRYAIFTDIIRGPYMVVIKGDDLLRAEKWGGFVKWVGGEKPETTRRGFFKGENNGAEGI